LAIQTLYAPLRQLQEAGQERSQGDEEKAGRQPGVNRNARGHLGNACLAALAGSLCILTVQGGDLHSIINSFSYQIAFSGIIDSEA